LYGAGNFLNSWGTVSFTRSSLLHAVSWLGTQLGAILEATIADSNVLGMAELPTVLYVCCAARHTADDTGNFTLMKEGEIFLHVQNLVRIVQRCQR